MKAVSAEKMREIDRQTIEDYGVSGAELMDRAGGAVADFIHNLIEMRDTIDPRISVFAGRGNNGGDAFVAARYLKQAGLDVEVLFAGDLSAVRGDALKPLRQLKEAGVSLQVLETVDEWNDLLNVRSFGADILVDGLLGTGSRGPARGPVAGAIQVINRFSDRALVVSIDIPSGLNADTGIAEGDAVVADVTLTMGLPKTGLLQPEALEFVGSVDVADIGIPEELTDTLPEGIELITPEDVASGMRRRPRRSHKGLYGHALLIGGGPGFSGAITMAAMAACRSGVGLVSVLTPADAVSSVLAHVPEAMVHGGGTTDSGSLAADAISRCFGERLEDVFSAVLIGPGLTTHPEGVLLIERVLASRVATVILDADALNLTAANPGLLKPGRGGVILTPHPGEMARLAGGAAVDVENDRFAAAKAAAIRFGAVCVLKGAGTVVTDGRRLAVNLSGNPGMATGGTGDVLAGLMAGLAAQGMDPFSAACGAVYLHGCAGDAVARMTSQAGVTACAIAEMLPRVFRVVQAR